MASHPLLSRDEFRRAVFARDRGRCVVCGAGAVDAHHILERRLWGNGGYYLANGASVCSEHHLAAEETTISCEEIRRLAGIQVTLLPEHLSADQPYDKWGNPILPGGRRMRGELFDEPSVQRILAPVLHLFTNKVKYPRTYHLPWSPGLSSDDKMLKDLSSFEGQRVIVTVKMDGENTTLYRDGMHARSIEYEAHESRTWIRAFHARFAHDIPEGYRLCGENLYAKHSIKYKSLDEWFLLFSVWQGSTCLSWDETVEWASLLDLKTVPVLYDGPWDEKLVRGLYTPTFRGDPAEGYVVRLAGSFSYASFRTSLAKYVRANHVTTDDHWKHSVIEPNGRVPV